MTETESRLRYKKTFSRLGWLYAGLMLGVQALGAAVAVLGVLVWPQLAETGWFSWVVSYVPLYGVCAPLFFLLLKKAVPAQPAAREKTRLRPDEWLRLFLLMLGAVYAFNIVSQLITLAIGALKGGAVTNPLASVTEGSSLWANVLFGCVVAPVGEEFLFRWAPARLAPRYGTKAYLVFSASAFALYHANLSQMLYAFAVGWLLGAIYMRTGNLWHTISLHMGVNVMGMLAAPALAGAGTAGALAVSLIVYGSMIGALILWVRRPRAVYEPGEEPLPARPVRTAASSAGMAAYIALCAVLTLLVTLM